MTTDLEQRLQDELRVRAGDAGPLRTVGGTVRRTADARRARRVRVGAVAGSAVLAAAVVVGVVGSGVARKDAVPPAGPNVGPTDAPATDRNPVRVQVSALVLQEAYALMAAGRPELLASAALPGSGDTVLVFGDEMQPDQQTVVRTVTVHDGQPLAGTVTYYEPWDHLVAQPARDGPGATLVVVAPASSVATTVEVTTSLPGKDIEVRRLALDHRLALVPLPSPQSVTRVRLLHGGELVEDRIPGDYYLGVSVPRPLGRVVVSAGGFQAVQVRTDGTTACRMTVAGLESADVLMLPWNPIDAACARIDPQRLRLLIAQDRRYSSVAGVAPRGAGTVRLHWRNGDVTEVPVVDDEVPAFVDLSGHRPDRLALAEALDRQGDVVDEARP